MTAAQLAATSAPDPVTAELQQLLQAFECSWPGQQPPPQQQLDASSEVKAVACLALGQLLQWVPEGADLPPPTSNATWREVLAAALQQLGAACSLPAMQAPAPLGEGQAPLAACCAVALAWQPGLAGAWKAYADLLYAHATRAGSSDSTGFDSQQQQQEQQQQQQGLLLAADAYCRYLAAAVSSKQLPSSEHGMQALLHLLAIVTQHADGLQSQLAGLLSSCPAAAWQVLTPQLFGQLQSSSAAVRALAQQLLQGVAIAAPSAVLYPAVAELRGAQVGSAAHCCWGTWEHCLLAVRQAVTPCTALPAVAPVGGARQPPLLKTADRGAHL